QFRKNVAQSKSLTVSAAEHLKGRDPDAAIQDVTAALGFWKENPVAYYLMGLAWQQKGDATRARANLERAIEIQPDYAEAHNVLGQSLWLTGDRRGSIAEFEKAIAVGPDLADAR